MRERGPGKIHWALFYRGCLSNSPNLLRSGRREQDTKTQRGVTSFETEFKKKEKVPCIHFVLGFGFRCLKILKTPAVYLSRVVVS